ncbi:MAG: hypothetical protein AB1465_03720 [Patescibacteria group bacterium]
MKYLYLLPFNKINGKILEKLAKDLEKKFDLSTKIVSAISLPDYTYNKLRRQYDGSKILVELKRMEFPDAEKILGVLSVDLFAEDLNFIFGQAEAPGNVALISLFRLDPKFWQKKSKPNQKLYFERRPAQLAEVERLFYARILKEAVHELGHTYGLSHCPDIKCVMHFSNTLKDTDLKNNNFCEKCKRLFEMLKK